MMDVPTKSNFKNEKNSRLKKISIYRRENGYIYLTKKQDIQSPLKLFFISVKVLEVVISRNSEERNVKVEMINDFREAPFINDFALTFRNTMEKPHYLHIKRTLHSQLHENMNVHDHIGEFRKNRVQITNA